LIPIYENNITDGIFHVKGIFDTSLRAEWNGAWQSKY